MLKKIKVTFTAAILIIWTWLMIPTALASRPVVTITQLTPVVQNMVAGSTQSLQYQVQVANPPSPPHHIVVHCNLNLNPANVVTAPTFVAANGCASPGGAWIDTTVPNGAILINLDLVAATGTQGQQVTGSLDFTQKLGRSEYQAGGSKSFPLNISIPSTSNRVVTFKNSCPFDVWFGVSSGSIPSKTAANHVCQTDTDCNTVSAYSTCVNGVCGGGWCQQPTDCQVTTDPNSPPNANDPPVCNGGSCSFCNSNSDCVGGGVVSSCNTSNHLCYWNVPSPSDASTNHYLLTQGTQDTVTFTDASNTIGFSLVWSGGFSARTWCTYSSGKNTCTTGDCSSNSQSNDGQGGCNIGEGFNVPSTQAEVTFAATGPDTYDMTIINGSNVPIAMYPNNAASPVTYNNPYNCGNTGGYQTVQMSTPSSATTLGGCPWSFSVPVYFQWVDTTGGQSCSLDSDCAAYGAHRVCGLTSSSVGTTGSGSSQTTCGYLLGYWNENEICAQNATFNQSGIVNCTQTGFNGGGNTLIQLLQCTGGNAGTSCYTSGANSACCGCTNWSMISGVPSSSSIVTSCSNPNSDWVGNVLPGLEAFKAGCPSAYVYPFDDKSSTFTCPQNGGQSAVNYTIEYCPGGETRGIAKTT